MKFAVCISCRFVKSALLKIRNLSKLLITALFLMTSLNATETSSGLQSDINRSINVSSSVNSKSENLNIFANLIVWTAREAGADCWAEVITTTPSASLNELQEVHFGWDPGFRVGAGYKMDHDLWDTQVYYTRFNTQGKDHISSGAGTVHSTFLGNFYIDNASGAGLSGPSYQKASVDWSIHFNMIDWELGRSFCLCKSLNLRPFLGVKGGWIHQVIHSKWEHPALTGDKFFNIGTEDLKNNFWGIGPGAGTNVEWNFFCSKNRLYLFGDFCGAVMWGHWSFSDLFKNDLEQQVSVDLHDLNSGASMMKTIMGFGWDANFSRFQFSAKLGYEMQFWLDQLQYYSFTGGRLANVLTLQGGTLEFCLNF